MLNQDLKDAVVSRILPSGPDPRPVRRAASCNSVAKDHRTVRGTVCLAFPDTYALGMSHHGLQVLYSLMNAPGLGLRAGRSRRCPTSRPALREHGLPLYSLETFTPLNQFDVARLLAPVRDLLHQRPDDARPRRDPAPRRGPRRRRHAGDRRRAGRPEPRAARALTSTCSSSATASRACRSSATSGKSMQGLRPVARGEAGADRRPASTGPTSPGSTSRSTARTARSSRSAGSATTCPAAIRPCVIQRPRRDAAADPADRAVRRDGARPDRHRDHARLPLAVPVLPEHRHQAPAPLPHGRDDRQGRARELPEHRLRRDQPALALDQRLPPLRGAGDADERGLHAAGGEDLAAQPADHRDAQEDPRAAGRRGGGAA